MLTSATRTTLVLVIVILGMVLAGCPQPSGPGSYSPPTYTITYNANGADSGTVPIDDGLYSIQDVPPQVLGNIGNLVRDGYTFNGWNTSPTGTGSSYSAGDSIIIGTANIILYAQWLELQRSAAPTFSPDTGSYQSPTTVTISGAPDATIYYTLTGDDPTTQSDTYSGALDLTTTTTVKAIAVESGKGASNVAEATYTILSSQSAPTFAPLPSLDAFTTSPQTIVVTAESGSTVYYTVTYTPSGGSAVVGTEQTYGSGIEIGSQGEGTYKIDVRAEKAGSTDATASATYTIDLPDAIAPVIGPATTVSNSAITVTITTTTSGATISYTTEAANDDVSTWNTWSPGDLVLEDEGDYTVKAVAGGNGFTQSAVTEATFTVDTTAPSIVPEVTANNGSDITFDFAVTNGPLRYVYIVAVANNANAPSQSQVVALDDAAGANALFGRRVTGSDSLNPLSDLGDGDYDWYFVAEDTAGNRSPVVKRDIITGYNIAAGTYTVTPTSGTAGVSQNYTVAYTPTYGSLFTYTGTSINLSGVGGDASVELTDGDSDGTWTFGPTPLTLSAGTYAIPLTVRAVDRYGNPRNAMAPFTTGSATISIVAP